MSKIITSTTVHRKIYLEPYRSIERFKFRGRKYHGHFRVLRLNNQREYWVLRLCLLLCSVQRQGDPECKVTLTNTSFSVLYLQLFYLSHYPTNFPGFEIITKPLYVRCLISIVREMCGQKSMNAPELLHGSYISYEVSSRFSKTLALFYWITRRHVP
jgi:hypothetical protein